MQSNSHLLYRPGTLISGTALTGLLLLGLWLGAAMAAQASGKIAMMPSYTQNPAYGTIGLNQAIEVWGRAWGGAAPYSYVLAYGDGTTNADSGLSEAQTSFYVGASHVYSSSGSKTVILTVTDSTNGVLTASAVVRVLPAPTHADRVNMAIERGKLYLYKNHANWDANRAFWYSDVNENGYGATGFALLAFEENGHLPGNDWQQDIYAAVVQHGLNTLASQAVSKSMSGNASFDTEGDGVAANITSSTYAHCIAANAFIMAFTSTNAAKNAFIPDGMGPFAGSSYYSFVVNMIEALYASQHADGAWHYSVDPTAPDTGSDGSTHQWPNIVMLTARDRWGLSIPPGVIASSMSAFQSLQGSSSGGCGYTSAGNWENSAKTGGMLGGYTLGNKFVGDGSVNRGLAFLGANWNNAPHPESDQIGGWAGDFYAMYGVKKGLQLQNVTSVSASDGPHNWYQDMSAWLLGDASLLGPNVALGYRNNSNAYGQNSDGSWTGSLGYVNSTAQGAGMTTAGAVLVLTKAVTKPMPVAVFGPIADQSSKVPAPFALDGSASYHMDPNSAIIEYLWIVGTTNLDWANPTASGKTATVNPGWTIPGSYPVTLRVKDNSSPANYATVSATVNVSDTDIAPVAVAVPPAQLPAIYTGKVGSTIYLDGSASYDPDGDTITNYVWDLNGDGLYGTAADAQLDTSGNNAQGVTASLVYAASYNGQIGLQVTANGKTSSNGSAVDVYAAPSDLAVDSVIAANIVPLVSATVTAVFTNDAGSGQALNNVVVRFFNANPFTSGTPLGSNYTVNLPIGGSASLTADLDLNGATNVYALIDANNAIPEWNEANNVAWVDVSTANHPPVVSNPVAAQAGTYHLAFSFSCPTNTFTDLDGDPLAYTATGLPPGIVFEESSLTFSGTPTAAGTFQVRLVASDGKTPPLTATNSFAFKVAKAAASVSLAGLSQSYGSTPRSASASTTPENLNVLLSYNDSSTPPSAAGSYTVVATIADPNYQGSVTDVLLIAKAPLSVSANNQTRTYGQANPPLSVAYDGFFGEDGPALLSVLPLAVTSANPTSPCGAYPIAVSGGVSSNYDLSYNGATLTVTKAPLVMIGDSFSRGYGQANPPFTARLTGVMNGDDITARFSTVATAQSIPGDYRITLNVNDPDGKLGNYLATLTSGILSVTNALLIGQVADQTRAYGQTNPVFTLTYSGFVNGQSSALLRGSLVLTCLETNGVPVGTNSPAGQYAISVATGQSGPNYTVAYQDGTLDVTQAVLHVTAGDATRVYGAANPAFSATVTGFVNGEDTHVLAGTLSLTSPALLTSPVGSYPIVPSGLNAANYTLVPENGTLTVTRADLVVSANNQNRLYGQPNPELSGTLEGVAAGDNLAATFASAAVSASPVGDYGILPVWLDPDNRLANYSVSTNRGTLTVRQATLSVSADPQTKTYGQPIPLLTGSLAGVQNQDGLTVTFATAATSSSAVGTYPIVPLITDPYNRLDNYLVVTNFGMLTNTPAPLMVSVDNKTRSYGDPDPVFTGTLDGLVNSDAITAGFASTATRASPVGSYPIVPVFQDPAERLGNYSLTTNRGSLSITGALLTVTAQNQTRAYGLANPPLTLTYAGFRNGEGPDVLSEAPSAATAAAPSSWPGAYPITLAGGVSSNYNFSLVDAVLTVTKGSLLVNGDDANRPYGQANPEFTAAMTGAAPGDEISFRLMTTADSHSLPGQYDIHISLDDPHNRLGAYEVTLLSGVLTVTKARLTATADNQTRSYGSPNWPLTLTYTGFAPGETETLLSALPVAETTAKTNSPVGAYEITLRGGSSSNYDLRLVGGTLTVTQATLLARADNQARPYGTTNPVLTVSYTGFVNGDTAADLQSAPGTGTAATPLSPPGSYAISLTGGLDHNYRISLTDGALTVSPATLTVTADPQSRQVGATNPVLTATITGFANGEDTNLVSGHPHLTTTADAASPVGAYAIEVDLGDLAAANYTFTPSNGVLTVGKALLVVTALDQTRQYGTPNPVLACSYSGFIDGDDANVLSGTPALSTPANQTSEVGTYPISISQGSLVSTNYALCFTNGTLSVTPAPLTVTVDNQSHSYGAALPAFTGRLTGLLNNDPIQLTVTSSATISSPVGGYDLEPGLIDPEGRLANYSVVTNQGRLQVTPAALIASADPQSRRYGAANPILSGTLLGLMNGDPVSIAFNTTASTGSPVGNYDIFPVLSDPEGKLANYAISTNLGTLTIAKAPLTVTAYSASRPYGTVNPSFTGSIAGLLNNDPLRPTFNSAASSLSPAGQYAIVAGLEDPSGRSSNYNVSFVTGILTVTAALTLADRPVVYLLGGGPGLLDGDASLADGGGLDFTGAGLEVRLTTNATAEDRLSIQPPGAGTGQVGVAPPNVTFGGVSFGSFTGGTGTNPLVFLFNSQATSPALSALLRQLTFATTATNPPVRQVRLTLTYNNQSLSVDREIELNRPPVAGSTLVRVAQGVPVGIPFSLVLSNAFDPEGEPLSIVAADRASTNGATVTLTSTNFTYVPGGNQPAQDAFTYVVADGVGGQAVGTVILLLQPRGRLGIDGEAIQTTGAHLSMMGTPGHVYRVLVSQDLAHWSQLRVVTATPTGCLDIRDADSQTYSWRFYRAVEQ